MSEIGGGVKLCVRCANPADKNKTEKYQKEKSHPRLSSRPATSFGATARPSFRYFLYGASGYLFAVASPHLPVCLLTLRWALCLESWAFVWVGLTTCLCVTGILLFCCFRRPTVSYFIKFKSDALPSCQRASSVQDAGFAGLSTLGQLVNLLVGGRGR